jgi:hypothetical protein
MNANTRHGIGGTEDPPKIPPGRFGDHDEDGEDDADTENAADVGGDEDEEPRPPS